MFFWHKQKQKQRCVAWARAYFYKLDLGHGRGTMMDNRGRISGDKRRGDSCSCELAQPNGEQLKFSLCIFRFKMLSKSL